jgi:toxin ParE1/3/4
MEWPARGVRNLVELRSYIVSESGETAAAVSRRILDAVELLTEHPEAGRPGRIPGTRELVIPRTPFLIPYRIKRGRVELIAALHGHQEWPKRL